MKSSYTYLSLLLIPLLGCSQSNQSTNDQTLSVNSVQGSYPLSGIYLYNSDVCSFDSVHNLDVRSKVALNGDIKTTDISSYPSVDSSCTGTETHRYKIISQITIEGDKTTSWDFSTVPKRDDGTGSLPAPVTASKVKSVVTDVSDNDPTDGFSTSTTNGSQFERLLYVDDTVYSTGVQATVYNGSIISGTDADGYPLLMDPDPIQYHP